MMGTSRTVSRCHWPSDSGSNMTLRRKAVERPSANDVKDQRVGAPQHELRGRPRRRDGGVRPP